MTQTTEARTLSVRVRHCAHCRGCKAEARALRLEAMHEFDEVEDEGPELTVHISGPEWRALGASETLTVTVSR